MSQIPEPKGQSAHPPTQNQKSHHSRYQPSSLLSISSSNHKSHTRKCKCRNVQTTKRSSLNPKPPFSNSETTTATYIKSMFISRNPSTSSIPSSNRSIHHRINLSDIPAILLFTNPLLPNSFTPSPIRQCITKTSRISGDQHPALAKPTSKPQLLPRLYYPNSEYADRQEIQIASERSSFVKPISLPSTRNESVVWALQWKGEGSKELAAILAPFGELSAFVWVTASFTDLV